MAEPDHLLIEEPGLRREADFVKRHGEAVQGPLVPLGAVKGLAAIVQLKGAEIMVDGFRITLVALHLDPRAFREGRRAAVRVEGSVLQAPVEPADRLFVPALETVAIGD